MTPTASSDLRGPRAREVILSTLVIVAVVAGFYLVYRFRLVVFLLLVAFILHVAITPVVNWLVAKRLPRAAAVALVYVALLLALALFVVLVGPMLFNQASDFADRIPEYYRMVRDKLIASPNYVLLRVALIAPPLPLSTAVGQTEADELAQVATFISGAGIALRVLLISLTIFALAYYWNLENLRAELFLLRFVPMERRARIREVVDEVESTVGAYLAGQLLLGLLVGAATLVAYLLIGLPYAAALAMLAGLFELIPLVGPVLSALVALLVALSNDPSKAIWVVVAAVVIQALENYILVPRVVGQSVGVNPLVTLLALLALGSLFGIPGALVAVPLAAIVQIALRSTVLNLDRESWDSAGARDKLALLRYEANRLVYDVRKALRRKTDLSTAGTDQPEELVEALALGFERIVPGQESEERAAS
ncbi:MAG: AI-2E family transporter [Caldilineales bacterium]